MTIWFIATLVLFLLSGDIIGSLFMGAVVWGFYALAGGTNTDPDRAYGEVDSDGDFGN